LFSEKFHKTLDFKTKIHQNALGGKGKKGGRRDREGKEEG